MLLVSPAKIVIGTAVKVNNIQFLPSSTMNEQVLLLTFVHENKISTHVYSRINPSANSRFRLGAKLVKLIMKILGNQKNP